MSAWGKTGRVTLSPWTGRRGISDAADVLIDGERVGHAGKDESGWYGASSAGSSGANSGDLGTFDAGVMHVLRRVDPALWRQERGAWLVRKRHEGDYVENGWWSGKRYPAVSDWLVIDPDGVCRNAHWTMHQAAEAARYCASEAVSA